MKNPSFFSSKFAISAIVRPPDRKILKNPTDIHSTIDCADIETSVQFLQTCAWYKKARTNPSEMAYILDNISYRAIQDAQQFSRR